MKMQNTKKRKTFSNAFKYLILLMGFLALFGCGKPPGTYVSKEKFEDNLRRQTGMTPQTMDQLAKHGITESAKLKLEFFFYTNTKEKANNLAAALTQKGYSPTVQTSASNSKEFVINGWTDKQPMKRAAVLEWTKLMVETGYKYDTEFDGWGTNIDQSQ